MTIPPATIDGASVKLFAKLQEGQGPTGRTRHSVANFQDVICAVVIAQYEDDCDFYLFYCTEDWRVVADTCHATLEMAIDQARFEFAELVFEDLAIDRVAHC
jgi:hypothetical protein